MLPSVSSALVNPPGSWWATVTASSALCAAAALQSSVPPVAAAPALAAPRLSTPGLAPVPGRPLPAPLHLRLRPQTTVLQRQRCSSRTVAWRLPAPAVPLSGQPWRSRGWPDRTLY